MSHYGWIMFSKVTLVVLTISICHKLPEAVILNNSLDFFIQYCGVAYIICVVAHLNRGWELVTCTHLIKKLGKKRVYTSFVREVEKQINIKTEVRISKFIEEFIKLENNNKQMALQLYGLQRTPSVPSRNTESN